MYVGMRGEKNKEDPWKYTGCSGKIVFFSQFNARHFQNSQPNASVQSHLLAGNFLYNQ